MKKIFALLTILSLLAVYVNIPVYAQEQNMISSAAISTDIPEKSGYPISNIADGRTNTPGVLDNKLSEQSFPYYIEFDFEEYTVQLSYIKIYSMYGKDAGVTNIGFQSLNNGEWTDIKRELQLQWDSSSSTVEDRTVYLSDKPVSNKFRLIINSANLSWNEFRIDEMELYGEISGLADKKNIIAFKTPYLSKSTTGNVTVPDKVSAKTGENEETEFKVTWDSVNTSSEGIYSVPGRIAYYEDIPTALIDVYDINKDISAYKNKWSYPLIKNAVTGGLLGSINTSGTGSFTRGEAALILFRKSKMQTDFPNRTYTDIESDIRYPIYTAVLQTGIFNSITDGSEFKPDGTMSRMQAVKLMTVYAQMNGAAKENVCDMAYGDIGDLPAADKEILKTAYEYGIIKNAAAFRPNDVITLDEFLSLVMAASGSSGYVEKEFADNGKILKNPYMGLFSYYTDNGTMKYDVDYPNSEYFRGVTGLSAVYVRTPWAFFEPKKDEYDFSLIDGLIEKYRRVGLQLCMRITASETGDEYATPKWVFEDGAKEIRWADGKGVTASGNLVMPDYDDPIFLERLEDFVAEFAKRYDGNPDIAYIDLGTLGVWGEGHTYTSGVSISESAVRKQLEIYSKYFKKTKVVLLDNTHNFMAVKNDAIAMGFGYRNDSFAGSVAQRFWSRDRLERVEGMWQKAPVVMELEHYDAMRDAGYWDNGAGLPNLIWENHASYLGLHGYSLAMEKGNTELFEQLSRRIGYRILPETVSLSAKADSHGTLSLKAMWKNLGVAPCYNGAYPAITLKDKDGNIVSVMVDDSFNVSALTVAPEGAAEGIVEEKNLRLHGLLPGGVYEAFISLGSISGKPEIAMPINGDDGEKRYYIGDVTVGGMYNVSAVQKSASELSLTFDVHDNCGDYDYLWPRLDFFDASNGERSISGDFTISLRDYYKEFESAVKNKSSYSTDVPVKFPNTAASKTYNVYFSMHNLSNGDSYGFMPSDNGRYLLLGTVTFDDSMNMKFTPAN